jgi:hypothetical protein
MKRLTSLSLFLATIFGAASLFADANAADALKTLQSMKPGDADMKAAQSATQSIQTASPEGWLESLRAMSSATPIGKNWLANIASAQYRTAVAKDASKAEIAIEKFLADQSNDPEARTLAFHWITDQDESQRTRRLANMTNDRSPELRYAAIEYVLGHLGEGGDVQSLEQLLDSARHAEQVRTLIAKLDKAGKKVDQAKFLGFVMQWDMVGPFDNRDQAHFDTVYDVERDLLAGPIDRSKKYVGKDDVEVAWREYTADDKEGIFRLAPQYNKVKGAVIYCHKQFAVKGSRPAQIRLTTVNANKVWLNGELILSNDVYHSGSALDQYIADVQLKDGSNTLIMKVLQNEQTEGWAQEYQFQCRISDPTGKAIEVTTVSESLR